MASIGDFDPLSPSIPATKVEITLEFPVYEGFSDVVTPSTEIYRLCVFLEKPTCGLESTHRSGLLTPLQSDRSECYM
ncbi:hypothetical protein GOODEAATRI_006906 [Goodea atripinnis]|uniref:Uncharacterized protein n=1 Tax=Goodea atripinnis TaxID=208336 RepID=A0ABV0MZB1_9TELE